MGNVIPFDGTVLAGEAMVNQASLTGESMPVRKSEETSVYAGTVVEEGEITVKVKAVGGSGRYDKIVTMIEDSQKLKSGLEGKAEHLADKLVPYTLAGTGLVYLATRNATKAIAVPVSYTHLTGYQVITSTNKKFTRNKKSAVSKKNRNLNITLRQKSKGTYYVKARSYIKIGKKYYYGPWSKVKKVTLR